MPQFQRFTVKPFGSFFPDIFVPGSDIDNLVKRIAQALVYKVTINEIVALQVLITGLVQQRLDLLRGGDKVVTGIFPSVDAAFQYHFFTVAQQIQYPENI